MHSILQPYLLLHDAVIITDVNHHILAVNSTFEQITGYDANQVQGRSPSLLKSKLTPQKNYREMYTSLRSNQPWQGIFINLKKNGELWHSSISITPLQIENEMFFVGIFRELEQVKQGIYIAEKRKETLQNAMMKVLAITSEIHDPSIEIHITRVRDYTEGLVKAYNELNQYKLSPDFIKCVTNASILHDIGKSGIPEGILYKPDKLASHERQIINMHPEIGVNILNKISAELNDNLLNDSFKIAYNIILSHHEKWDGTGYPNQLQGNEIPLEARIVAIVDVYDALTSKRPYKNAWTHEQALKYLIEQKGKHFDPQLIDALLSIYDVKEHSGLAF